MKRLIILSLLVLVGCGALDPLRGHNIRMARDALQAARKPLDAAYEKKKAEAETEEGVTEVEQEHFNATAALDDVERRLNVAQRDFPPPKVPKGEKPVVRSTPGKVVEEDEYRYEAYSGLVHERQLRREFWGRLKRPFEQLGNLWNTAIWAVTATIYILIVIAAFVVSRKLYGVYQFLMRLLDEVVPDKEKRRKIAQGTPVGDVYDKDKKKRRKAHMKAANNS